MAVVPSPPSPLTEPMIFLSAKQTDVITSSTKILCNDAGDALRKIAEDRRLPCWVPARVVGRALGFSDDGVNLAVSSPVESGGTGGRPYLWSTEFENVHTFWRYNEPVIQVQGDAAAVSGGGEEKEEPKRKTFACSEEYYHSQKPVPFSDALWNPIKEQVMERAVRAKIKADSAFLVPLLLATHPHPLLSVKGDSVWGFDPRRGGGENLLAKIWMRIRSEMVVAASATQHQALKEETFA